MSLNEAYLMTLQVPFDLTSWKSFNCANPRLSVTLFRSFNKWLQLKDQAKTKPLNTEHEHWFCEQFGLDFTTARRVWSTSGQERYRTWHVRSHQSQRQPSNGFAVEALSWTMRLFTSSTSEKPAIFRHVFKKSIIILLVNNYKYTSIIYNTNGTHFMLPSF